MNVAFSKKSIEESPKEYARVRFTEEARGTKRLVRESGIETLELGAGKPGELTMRTFRIFCRAIIQTAKTHKAKKIAVAFSELYKLIPRTAQEEVAQTAAENFEMAHFEWNVFKTEPKEGWNVVVEEVLLCEVPSKSVEEATRKGKTVGEAVNACRALANTPGGDMTPTKLAKAAKEAVKGVKVKVTTLGLKELQKLGFGALLGVAKGSSEEPTFTVMEYRGGGKERPIVLAGKGITFDSGGLNLKPSNGIYEMHMDMSGAAAVIHTVALTARLNLKKNVVGLIPSAENMPGNNAVRPGDILKSLSGKTIEVVDTDAEGRLVLADALTYAKRFDPSVVIDAATLTGAAHVALGNYASGLMTRNDALSEKLLVAGESSGDYLWRLPLWDEYEEALKSDSADIANLPQGTAARYGGATNGGIFLWQFAKELNCPWAHLDIAPRMTSVPGEELAKGAAGTPVRLLLRFIEEWKS